MTNKLLVLAGCAALASAATTVGSIKYGGDESKNICFDLPGGNQKDGNKFWVW